LVTKGFLDEVAACNIKQVNGSDSLNLPEIRELGNDKKCQKSKNKGTKQSIKQCLFLLIDRKVLYQYSHNDAIVCCKDILEPYKEEAPIHIQAEVQIPEESPPALIIGKNKQYQRL
jgi:hypothetical protein